VVVDVMAASPAARGGLQPCDLIEKVAGQTVRNPSEVQLAVDRGHVGQPLPITVRRGGLNLELKVRPEELRQRG